MESPGDAPGESEDADERLLANNEELEEVQRQIVEALAAHGLDASVSQHLDSRGLAVSIATDDVLFASGSPTLSPQGAEIIASLTPILDAFDNLILLEGHTDTVPLDQNGYTNWNLSADRALAVLEILDNAGLKPGRLSATGYGEHRPISGNDTEEGRAANRRVEIVIVAETPGITEN
jgi:chemotaxis protein MotB